MAANLGYSAFNWRYAATFTGHCASPADVDQAHAVFALGDTLNGRPMEITLPAPVIWYDEDEEFAALVVQAEAHETEEDGPLEMMGLLLPSGETAISLIEDVEFVDAADPVWLALLEADETPGAEDGAEWASGYDEAADVWEEDAPADDHKLN